MVDEAIPPNLAFRFVSDKERGLLKLEVGDHQDVMSWKLQA
jgi:hypothetical protein